MESIKNIYFAKLIAQITLRRDSRTDLAKTSLKRPSSKITCQILQMNKRDVTLITGLVRRHYWLNKHLSNIGVKPDLTYRGCVEEAETKRLFI